MERGKRETQATQWLDERKERRKKIIRNSSSNNNVCPFFFNEMKCVTLTVNQYGKPNGKYYLKFVFDDDDVVAAAGICTAKPMYFLFSSLGRVRSFSTHLHRSVRSGSTTVVHTSSSSILDA